MNTEIQNKKRPTAQKGFALLVGMVVSIVLISVTYTMFSITLKQITLSTAGRDSQIALYAADAGLECVLYEDINTVGSFVVLTVPDGINISLSEPSASSVNCNNGTSLYTPQKISVGDSEYPLGAVRSGDIKIRSYFYINSSEGDKSCAIVEVWKYLKANTSGVKELKTKIKSRGYNTCPDLGTDPLRVERGLEVYY